MKINIKNYLTVIQEIGLDKLPEVLQQSHNVLMSKTNDGQDWSNYKGDTELKNMADLIFQKLEEYLKSIEPKERESELGEVKPKTAKKDPYSKIALEVSFIKRFLEFHDKVLYKNTFEIFIDELQKAIQEKIITKKSPAAKEIQYIQEATISAFNTMRNAEHFQIKPETQKRLKAVIEKHENAYDDLDKEYVKKQKKSVPLNGVIPNSDNVMCSTDFTALEFKTIGFKDKWLEFIGDPAPGFTAMVYGRPKMGKSYLCVDFAGYLARNHGKVLYVAKEEKLDKTLQDKLKNKEVAHVNLFVSDQLPEDLTSYEFVFLDSVNKLGLNVKDLEVLKEKNIGKSFIYIFQVTKDGKFRGNNEFQHNVDIVIDLPELGKAIQFGRFNQGGQLNIF